MVPMSQETLALKQANSERFPMDFMFELDAAEMRHLVSQAVTPGLGKLGGPIPMAFTEQGVAKVANPA